VACVSQKTVGPTANRCLPYQNRSAGDAISQFRPLPWCKIGTPPQKPPVGDPCRFKLGGAGPLRCASQKIQSTATQPLDAVVTQSTSLSAARAPLPPPASSPVVVPPPAVTSVPAGTTRSLSHPPPPPQPCAASLASLSVAETSMSRSCVTLFGRSGSPRQSTSAGGLAASWRRSVV